jgi:hypothetical protein
VITGDQIKKNEMSRACGTYGEEETYVQDFGEEAYGRRIVERPTPRWEGIIKMVIVEVRWGHGLDRSDLG